MKTDKLQDAIGMIDEDLIADADNILIKQKKHRIKWVMPVAAVLALVIALTPFLRNVKIPDNPFVIKSYAINEAKYPQMTQYPLTELGYKEWSEDQKTRRQYFGAGENLDEFFKKTYSQILSDSGEENKLYSPLNMYMALAMLAEITEGESRQQILELIGAEEIESLRKQANSVWNANYNNDGAVTSVIANSLWLNENVTFNNETLKVLADNYFASSYQGEMGSSQFNQAFQKWLNQQTGSLLKEQISNIEFDSQTVMTIATTLYYQAKWDSEFKSSQNTQNIFKSPFGDITCDFMNQTETYGIYYWGEKFSAVSKELEMSGRMWFILPDESISVDELLKSNEVLNFMNADGDWKNKKQLKVNLSVPKFDVCSNSDLKKDFESLGVKDCFDSSVADFSPLIADFNDYIYLSKVQHGVRVAIDEEGVTAATYTVLPMAGAAMPPEDEIDFVVNRPFIFVITGEDGLPLFAGVINQP